MDEFEQYVLPEGSDEDSLEGEDVFEAIMERLLARVPDTLDTREGSVLYNALAPAAWEIQLLYEELNLALQEAFADTASLDYLARRAAERGVSHKAATRAIVRAEILPDTVDVMGGRFTELSSGLSYIVTEQIQPGLYDMECETEGEAGNLSSGQLMTDEVFDDETELQSAQIVSLTDAASEEEDVEAFRQRYLDSIGSQAFGGNIADYKQKLLAQERVGGVKVFPVWNGGGTVKVVVLNNTYAPPGDSAVNDLQTLVDPEQNQGAGIGLATIGHIVTVEAAEAVPIHITAELVFVNGVTEAEALPSMNAAVEEYFLSLRSDWGNHDYETGTVVRISHIENKLLSLEHLILDVQVSSINGSDKNMELAPNQVPVIGEITNGISGT